MQEFTSGDYQILELKAEKFKPLKPYTLRINVEDQRISGVFDCNNFSSEYEKDGQNIKFNYAMSSKMYCEGNMHNENAFFSKLKDLNTFSFDGEILKLYDKSENMILKLKKQES